MRHHLGIGQPWLNRLKSGMSHATPLFAYLLLLRLRFQMGP